MRRAGVIGIAAGAAALIIGGAVVWWLVSRPLSAEASATRYLDALAAGDYGAVDDLRSEPLEPAAEAVLAQAFEGASEYVRSPRIDELVEEDDGHGARDRRARRRGAHAHLRAVRGGRAGGCSPATTSAVSPSRRRSATRPGWATHSLPSPRRSCFSPRCTRSSSAPRGLLDGEGSATIAGRSCRGHAGRGTHARGDRALPRSRSMLYAETCAEPAVAVPPHCGLKVPWAADLATLSDLAFQIETLPTVRLSPDGTTFTATDGVIVATARREAHAPARRVSSPTEPTTGRCGARSRSPATRWCSRSTDDQPSARPCTGSPSHSARDWISSATAAAASASQAKSSCTACTRSTPALRSAFASSLPISRSPCRIGSAK